MDREVAFTTDEGYQYLVSFTTYTEYSKRFGAEILDVSITLMSGTVESNTYKTLSAFVKIIFDFLVDFPDAVLYYYCDSAPIKIRNNRNQNFTPQQFRSELFMKLFLKINNPQFISRNFSVNDPEVGSHYITLITNEKQEVILNSIVIELKDLFEK